MLKLQLICHVDVHRAAYCRNAIAITLSIKNNFHRYLPSQGDTSIVQYMIPYPMPAHMVNASSALTDTASLNSERCSDSPRAKEATAQPPSPVKSPLVKRPYNKKRPRLSVPCLSTEEYSCLPFPQQHQEMLPIHQSSAVPVLNIHYFLGQPHPSSPLVSDRASSDSGTDDESIYRGQSAQSARHLPHGTCCMHMRYFVFITQRI